MQLLRQVKLKNAVKEALDNLPYGVCFFNADGIPVLYNHRIYELVLKMSGQDLQTLPELWEALGVSGKAPGESIVCRFPDDTRWSFLAHELRGGRGEKYTEITAIDVTELCQKRELLEEANEAQRHTIDTLKQIQDNIVSITREEEILAMKMEMHHEFAYNLQTIRRYYLGGCPAGEKEAFLAAQRKTLQKMRGELGVSDEIDSFAELERLAKTLGMKITVRGKLPGQPQARERLAEVLRECMINTTRHAGGTEVILTVRCDDTGFGAIIENDGRPPEREIVESGGLASLRRRVEGNGGTMKVRSLPTFQLHLWLPINEEEQT